MTFAKHIHEQLVQPGTCAVGYNSLRFDGEITRQLLYRNFYDPYGHEWEHGNARWDLIDLVRMCHALRPEGMIWPRREDGAPSFRLEELADANKLIQDKAHDALSDVYATIDLARRIRQHQPKLWIWYFALRRKQRVLKLLRVGSMQPLLHVSSRYPASAHCLAIIVPLARHPARENEIIVYDLSVNPKDLIARDEEAIADRVFTARNDLPEGVERIPLRTIRINRSPALAPLSALDKVPTEHLKLNRECCLKHLEQLRQAAKVVLPKVQKMYTHASHREAAEDPELALYDAFLKDTDKALLRRVRDMSASDFAQPTVIFHDSRYTELLFRYRARHFPQTLNLEEHARWEAFRQRRLTCETALAPLTLDQYFVKLKELRDKVKEEKQPLLDQLQAWGEQLMPLP